MRHQPETFDIYGSKRPMTHDQELAILQYRECVRALGKEKKVVPFKRPGWLKRKYSLRWREIPLVWLGLLAWMLVFAGKCLWAFLTLCVFGETGWEPK